MRNLCVLPYGCLAHLYVVGNNCCSWHFRSPIWANYPENYRYKWKRNQTGYSDITVIVVWTLPNCDRFLGWNGGYAFLYLSWPDGSSTVSVPFITCWGDDLLGSRRGRSVGRAKGPIDSKSGHFRRESRASCWCYFKHALLNGVVVCSAPMVHRGWHGVLP